MNSLIKSILLIIFSLGLSFSQQSVMDDEGFYLMCEKMPELIGGMDGLQRKININGKYERVQPFHSWNSNHPIGRIMLFELSRHSDHHFNASRKYQILKNHENSPEMPTGYPGMMILSLFPPLWFYVMNKRIKKIIT